MAKSEDWHTQDVTIAFMASDELSGLDSVDSTITVTEEGENQEIIGTATDLDGNRSAWA